MTDDLLSTAWRSDPPPDKSAIARAVDIALEEDRLLLAKERLVRHGSVIVMGVLCPVLLACAGFGVTPLVRIGYGLMAAGTAVITALEWAYLSWSRQALPGPIDTRAQLQKTAFLLARQASLLRTGFLWGAPVFVGTALVALWVYRQRSHAGGYLLWALIGIAWVMSALAGIAKGAALRQRKQRIEQLLRDLQQS